MSKKFESFREESLLNDPEKLLAMDIREVAALDDEWDAVHERNKELAASLDENDDDRPIYFGRKTVRPREVTIDGITFFSSYKGQSILEFYIRLRDEYQYIRTIKDIERGMKHR